MNAKVEYSDKSISKKSLKQVKQMVLKITPEISAILKDITNISKKRIALKTATDEEKENAAESGVEIIEEFIQLFFTTHYDGILKILAAIYDVKVASLEEKAVEEIFDMTI